MTEPASLPTSLLMSLRELNPTRSGRPRSLARQRGFTLIEILVVISIIGILTTLGVVSVNSAKSLARESKAKEDLHAIHDAIALLQADTGKWPNGCKPEAVANPEVNLNDAQAGLKQRPAVGNQGDGCFWAAADVAHWNGPYVQYQADPWSQPYWFDPDYTPYQNCPSKTRTPETVVVLSFGPNRTGVNAYDCDDIFLRLK